MSQKMYSVINKSVDDLQQFLSKFNVDLRTTELPDTYLIKCNQQTALDHPEISSLRGLIFNANSKKIYSLTYSVPIEVKDLKVGDTVVCRHGMLYKNKDVVIGITEFEDKKDTWEMVPFHPRCSHSGGIVYRLIYEASMNNLSYEDYLNILREDEEKSKSLLSPYPLSIKSLEYILDSG